MVLLAASLDVVAVAEPQRVHGLSVRMDSQPRAQRREMRLDRSLADPQAPRCSEMSACSDVRAKHLKLTVRWRQGVARPPFAGHAPMIVGTDMTGWSYGFPPCINPE